jgi:hypothetical protein
MTQDMTLAERVGLRTLHNLGWTAVNGVYARDIPQSLIDRGLVSNDGITLELTAHGKAVAHAVNLEGRHEAP